MAKCFVDDTSLTNVANKIREQSGETKQLVFPTDFISTVGNLENVTQEVNTQTSLIEQILAALGGAVDPQPAVVNALTSSGGVYLTVMEE